MARRRRKLTPSEHERLVILALCCLIGNRYSSRRWAPFLPDRTATIWKLVRKGYVEADLRKSTGEFRPTELGWQHYDEWCSGTDDLELAERRHAAELVRGSQARRREAMA